MVGFDGAGGGGETEHEIDGGDDLERAAITMALHPRDPFRVDHAGAHDAGDFFLQRADFEVFGAGGIEMPGSGFCARERLDRSRQPALELVVLVRIEKVVLRIVLGVEHGIGRFQALGKG